MGLGIDGLHPSDPEAVISHARLVSFNSNRTTMSALSFVPIFLFPLVLVQEMCMFKILLTFRYMSLHFKVL